jgi:hypothetical protein
MRELKIFEIPTFAKLERKKKLEFFDKIPTFAILERKKSQPS